MTEVTKLLAVALHNLNLTNFTSLYERHLSEECYLTIPDLYHDLTSNKILLPTNLKLELIQLIEEDLYLTINNKIKLLKENQPKQPLNQLRKVSQTHELDLSQSIQKITPKKETPKISKSPHSPPDEFNFSARGPVSARKVKRINLDDSIGLSPLRRSPLDPPPIEFRSIPPPPLPQLSSFPLSSAPHDFQCIPSASPVLKPRDSTQQLSPSQDSPSQLLDLEKYLDESNQTFPIHSPHSVKTIGFIDLTSDSFSHLPVDVDPEEESQVVQESELIEPSDESHTKDSQSCSDLAVINMSDGDTLNLVELSPVLSQTPVVSGGLLDTFSDFSEEIVPTIPSESQHQLITNEVEVNQEEEAPETSDNLVRSVEDCPVVEIVPAEEVIAESQETHKTPIVSKPTVDTSQTSDLEISRDVLIETHVSFSSSDSSPPDTSNPIEATTDTIIEDMDHKVPQEELPHMCQELNLEIGTKAVSENGDQCADDSQRILQNLRPTEDEVSLNVSHERKDSEKTNHPDNNQLSENQEALVVIENQTISSCHQVADTDQQQQSHDPPLAPSDPPLVPSDPPLVPFDPPTVPSSHSEVKKKEMSREIGSFLEFLEAIPTVGASGERRSDGNQEAAQYVSKPLVVSESHIHPYDRLESRMGTLLDQNDEEDNEYNAAAVDNFAALEMDAHENSEEEIELDIQYDSPQSSVTQSDFDTVSEFDLHHQALAFDLRRIPIPEDENPSSSFPFGVEATTNEPITSSSIRRNTTLSSFISAEEPQDGDEDRDRDRERDGGRDEDQEGEGEGDNENVDRAWRVYSTEEGYHYHYNHITDESTWHCPLGLYLDRETRPAAAAAGADEDDEEEFRECECMQLGENPDDHGDENEEIYYDHQSDRTRDWNQPFPESENQILVRERSSSTLSSIDPTSEIRTLSQRISPANQSQIGAFAASNLPIALTSPTPPHPEASPSLPAQTSPPSPDQPRRESYDSAAASGTKKPSRWKQIKNAFFRR